MTRKHKILLVDDDIDFVESTRTVLESKPYEVIVAYDGAEGIKKAKEENPDLVILDIIMPVKDGFSAAEQFKNDRELSKIPVIMLTSFSAKHDKAAIPVSSGMMLDAEDYIEKPIEPTVLLKTISKYLSK
jgi:two-component system alkaline phosphatase synthesis response regulator PhoP